MTSTLDATRAELALLVLYLNKAEARDKICRAIQYGSKFLSNGKPGTAQNVDKTTSLARKVFRLFKFICKWSFPLLAYKMIYAVKKCIVVNILIFGSNCLGKQNRDIQAITKLEKELKQVDRSKVWLSVIHTISGCFLLPAPPAREKRA
ncbi:hypothetical protein B296_00001958 [Ensete ventricosum]|uniref:Uncharacterized protein n=1 Tax=Ensete ventricosum TaxID=4639 RepID=A0A427B809_ENSVE|nr:hypothetical protein B296_00001958 [Ensete ventricosum]